MVVVVWSSEKSVKLGSGGTTTPKVIHSANDAAGPSPTD